MPEIPYTEPEINERNKEPLKKDVNDIFYCFQCKKENILSGNPKFCTECGYEFPRNKEGEILIDNNNFTVFSGQSQTFNQSNVQNPYLAYPSPVLRTYPTSPRLYRRKIRSWNMLAGIVLPVATFIILFVGSLILLLLFTLFGIPMGISEFFIGSLSLIFLFAPLLWIKRYFPGNLSFKQRLGELGLPFNKYSKNELRREILLGVLIGLVMLIFAWIFQTISYYTVQWLYKVDIYNLMASYGIENFNLDSPTTLGLILVVLQMLIFVGFPEEIMFRGFVQKSFESKLTKSSATLLTAFFFASFHIFIFVLYPPIFLFLFIPYLGISICLGLTRNWRDDLFAVGVAHIVYNSIQFIVIYFIFL